MEYSQWTPALESLFNKAAGLQDCCSTYLLHKHLRCLYPQDVWLSSKYASGFLDASCKMVSLYSFILQYLYHTWFVFCLQKWKHYIEKYLIATVCYVMHAFLSESTLDTCLNVQELLAQNMHIWSLRDCNETQIQNHLLCKQTINHLAKLARLVWLNGWVCRNSKTVHIKHDSLTLKSFLMVAAK